MRARSDTASTGTITRYPSDIPSTTVARTQPDVVVPHTMTVSTPRAVRRSCRSVPKNAEGCCFSNTTSPASGVTSGSMSQPSDPRTQATSPGHLTPNGPASERSGSYAQYE